MMTPAIFLDRDGVINENRPDHVKSWQEFCFLPGALDALRALTRLGVPIVIVTNQAAIGRQLVTHETVETIHQHMHAAIRQVGGAITTVLYCPHRPEEHCACRKPAPGLLFEAAQRLQVDLARSVLVGDAESDIQAGQRAQCQTVLVLTGRGRGALQPCLQGKLAPTAIANDLGEAVPLIERLLWRAPYAAPPAPLPWSEPPSATLP